MIHSSLGGAEMQRYTMLISSLRVGQDRWGYSAVFALCNSESLALCNPGIWQRRRSVTVIRTFHGVARGCFIDIRADMGRMPTLTGTESHGVRDHCLTKRTSRGGVYHI